MKRRPKRVMLRDAWLVSRREILARLHSKAFVISTGVLLVGVLAGVLIGGWLGGQNHRTSVAAVGPAQALVRQMPKMRVLEAQDAPEAEQMVRDGEAEAAVIPDASSPVRVKVVAKTAPPLALVEALSVAPAVHLLEPPPGGKSPLLSSLVAVGFGLVFLLSAMTFGQTIAQSVVEEKQTRVVEILLAAVDARTLLTGKILGNSLMAFAQIAAIGLLATAGLLATGQHVLLGDLGPSIAWFVVFFAVGFVMIAALFAGTAALVSRQEDVASATMPVMTIVFVPYFLIIAFSDSPGAQAVLSYVPFSAVLGMPARLFAGTAGWWEPFLSLALLVATTLVMIGLGARLYRNSLLRTGARVRLREALRG